MSSQWDNINKWPVDVQLDIIVSGVRSLDRDRDDLRKELKDKQDEDREEWQAALKEMRASQDQITKIMIGLLVAMTTAAIGIALNLAVIHH